MLEFSIDSNKIDARRNESMWLRRAAQSLAEALRIAASKELDIEFTELVTGYRYRENEKGNFIDIYFYDSLSSGAGYAVSVSKDIVTLLSLTHNLLINCDCQSACYNCLKHYRNQHVHGLLDRFAALELLNWGMKEELPQDISFSEQKNYISSLENILATLGFTLSFEENNMFINSQKSRKQIVVYPAMLVEPSVKDNIFISDAYIKYAKPYAVQKIKDAFANENN